MSKDLQETSNMKLQESFKKVLELIDNGNFYIDTVSESAGGSDFDKLNKDDLYARNKITLNLTVELHKLPGMENAHSSVGNLVTSTVVDLDPYYDNTINMALQDLKDTSAIFDVLNKFIASKVNNIMGEIIERGKESQGTSNVNQLRVELGKELSNSAVQQDMNRYLQVLIEKNLADPVFVSKLQASINYEQFKKSIIRDDKLEFSQCINSYVNNRIDFIVQQRKDELIEDIKRAHPEMLKSAKFHDYITSRIIEQNERLKSTILIKINEQEEHDIVNLKTEMNENVNDDERLNEIMNNFLLQTVEQAAQLAYKSMYIKEEDALGGDKKLSEDINNEVNEYIAKLIRDNIQNSSFKDVSTLIMMKSTLPVVAK